MYYVLIRYYIVILCLTRAHWWLSAIVYCLFISIVAHKMNIASQLQLLLVCMLHTAVWGVFGMHKDPCNDADDTAGGGNELSCGLDMCSPWRSTSKECILDNSFRSNSYML